MIQFNLLPDVKLDYIKAQRTKGLVISVSLLVSAVSLAIFILLLLSVNVLQRKNINDLSKDIKTTSAKLKGQQNLDKILTVQNQLNALKPLHDQKAVASRLPDYIGQVTPTNVSIGSLDIDFASNKITISGRAATLDSVNVFVDSLKFTKYTTSGSSDKQKAFPSVVLSSFGKSDTNATYTIDLTFDPVIFSNENAVTLIVPNIITTRSITEHPALFEGGN